MAPTKKFVPRQRKHKALARTARGDRGDGTPAAAVAPVDSNRTEILPEEIRLQNEKKAQLRAELRAGQPQMSAKKAKRLEKYIETKLRKDENRVLYERLAAKQIDTTLFESSKSLGVGKKRRNAARRKKEMEKRGGEERGSEEEESEGESEGDSEGESEEDVPMTRAEKVEEVEVESVARPTEQPKQTTQPTQPTQQKNTETATTGSSLFAAIPPTPAMVGSGLKRPLEVGDDGRPVLQKRQKRGGVKSKYQLEVVAPVVAEEWGGFSDEEEEEAEDEEKEDEEEDDDDEEKEKVDESEEKSASSGSDSENDSENDDNSNDNSDSDPPPSGFKAWAQQQRNDALGFQETTESTTAATLLEIPRPDNFQPRPVEEEPLPVQLQTAEATGRQVFNVAVTRTPEVEAARLALPVVAEEQQIMEAIHAHDVVVITGGTGSGKTTQVPQFLFEAGYGAPGSATPGLIGVTQPRRVAAVSMARRVAEELGDHGAAVAYQIRFEGTADAQTAIKFMTDGVLLRELADDVVLSRYAAVIVDEAHERSINTDVLIGILSRVNAMRADHNARTAATTPLAPLKLIIMSATLQIDDLTQNRRLFAVPPRVVRIEGRQFPVTEHFAQTTRADYVDEAFRKIVRGHRKLPAGSFLVFLTGEDEIQQLARRLRLEINGLDEAAGPRVRLSAQEVPYEAEDVEFGGGSMADDLQGEGEVEEEGDEGDEGPEEDIEEGDDKDNDDEFALADDEDTTAGPLRINVLPLYSKLPTREQQRVFRPAPAGCRQVILATNVAETSVTIPGVRYVFDCGRAKARRYNPTTGVQSFEVGWISKASAHQRSGRAGRTGPGHCYRLYSSALFEASFAAFAAPEVLRMPIEGVVLQLKALHVPRIDAFPFPTPPDRASLARAERLLQHLGAIAAAPSSSSSLSSSSSSGPITALGRLMAAFPLAPRFSKILLVAHVQGCLPYAVALVAALSADELFVRPSQVDAAARPLYGRVHRQFSTTDPHADAVKLLHVVAEYADVAAAGSATATAAWCRGHFVLHKPLDEIQRMRRQLTDLLRAAVPALAHLVYEPRLAEPSAGQVALLKQIVAAGFLDHVAIRADAAPDVAADTDNAVRRTPRSAIEVPYRPLVPLASSDPSDSGLVYIHPSSLLARGTVGECPTYLVYSHLQRAVAAPATSDAPAPPPPKIRMRTLTDLPARQLATLARGTPLLSYGKPIKETSVSADGRERTVWVVPYLRAEDGAGGLGWPLPAVQVQQRRVPGRGWDVIN